MRLRSIVTIMIILCIGFWWARIGADTPMNGIEAGTFDAVRLLPEWLHVPMLVLTQLGGIFGVVFVVVGLYLKRGRLAATYALACASSAYAIVELLKVAIARPRPVVLDEQALKDVFAYGYGFPSGHATMAAVLGLMIGYYASRRWYLLIGAGVLLIACSRVYLGVHSPLDVLAGILLGGFIFCAGYLIKQLYLKKLAR